MVEDRRHELQTHFDSDIQNNEIVSGGGAQAGSMTNYLALTGWYGHGNIGDELLKSTILNTLKSEFVGARPIVLGEDKVSGTTPDGDISWRRPPFWFSRLGPRMMGHLMLHTIETKGAWLRSLRSTLGLVIGGGSLLHDRQPENLTSWYRLIKTYKAAGAKVVFYGVGIDPLTSPRSRDQRNRILDLADGISVRDRISAVEIEDGLGPGRVTLAADPVLNCPLLPAIIPDPIAGSRLKIGFNMRPLTGVPLDVVVAQTQTAAEAILKNFEADLEFIPMWRGDLELAEAVRALLSPHLAVRYTIAPFPVGNLRDHISRYATYSAVVAMRFHIMVLASLHGVPIAGLDYDPKIQTFLTEIGMDRYRSVVAEGAQWQWRGFDVCEVVSNLREMLNRKEALRSDMLSRINLLKQREKGNLTILRNAIGGVAA